MRTVAVETNVLIWGVKNQCTPGQESMKKRARQLLRVLEQEEASIIVPAISIAELMAPMSEAQRGRFLQVMEARFVCAPFNTRAASIAAKLWHEHKALPKKQQLTRTVLKADVFIIASAFAAGARVFYSHDAKCRALADKIMIAHDLPTHPDTLFDVPNP